ncbi:MAG: DMT family transporter [Bdellovibrio sp.]
MTKRQAVLEMIFAGMLWGFGFIATVWALEAFTPVETLVYRFAVASVVSEVIYLVIKGPRFFSLKEEVQRAFPAGLFLGALLLLQTIGLQYTTATKSGFLTCLYVILVPVLNTLFFRARSSWYHYALVGLALGGTFMLVDADLRDINIGDLWTIACSIFAALHIIYIGRVSSRVGNAFRFNNFQSIWCLLILCPLLFTQETVTVQSTQSLAWAGVIYLGLGSSLVAFYLQIRTQKILSDTTASMLFLLESPFAALFGFILLHERLSPFQMTGAALILLASAIQILLEPATKTTETTPE